MNEFENELENEFDKYLEMIFAGNLTVEECLAKVSAPDKIEALLRMAIDLRDAGRQMPEPANKATGREAFLKLVDRAAFENRTENLTVSGDTGPTLSSMLNPRNWGTSLRRAAIATVALITVSGGVATASTNSLPNGPLYSVKIALEGTKLLLPKSNFSQAILYINIANTRLGEINALIADNQFTDIPVVAADLNENLDKAASLRDQLSINEQKILDNRLAKLRDALNDVLEFINNLIEESESGQPSLSEPSQSDEMESEASETDTETPDNKDGGKEIKKPKKSDDHSESDEKKTDIKPKGDKNDSPDEHDADQKVDKKKSGGDSEPKTDDGDNKEPEESH